MRLPGLKHLRRIAAIALVASLLVATPILAAVYEANVVVEEDGTSGYTMLGVMAAVDVENLVSEGFITATGLDTRVLAAGAEIPHTMAGDTLIFAYPIAQGALSNFTFQTGQSALSDYYIICGYDGYITTPDTAALELGAEFELEISGWIDTAAGADRNLMIKSGGFELYIDGATNITATMYELSAGTAYAYPGAQGFYHDYDYQYPTSGDYFEKVDDPQGAPDDNTTYIKAPYTGPWHETYTLAANPFNPGDVISSVDVYYRIQRSGGTSTVNYVAPMLRLGGTDVIGTQHASTGVWATWNEVLARPGGGSWTVADFDSLEIGVWCTSNSFANKVTSVYIKVTFEAAVVSAEVTATGVASGEHIVNVEYDGFWLTIDIDGSEEDADGNATSVPDNVADIIWNEDNVLPYIDYITLDVGGVEVIHYDPEVIILGRAYSTGTATFTNGSPAVVGAATTWTEGMVGGWIYSDTDGGAWYGISAVADTTHLTLDINYAEAGGAGQSYTMSARLIDETGASQDGVITWGANPAGVTVNLGGLAVSGVGGVAPGAGAPPAAGGTFNPGDYVSTTVDSRSAPGTPFDSLIVFFTDITGWPDELAWGMVVLALMLTAFTLTFAKFQSLLWGGTSASLVVGLFVGMGVLDNWFLILIPLMVISGLAVDKRQTL